MNEFPEVWRDVRNIPKPRNKNLRYIVSNRGEIRSVYRSGKWRVVGLSKRSEAVKGSPKRKFIFRYPDGKKHEKAVAVVVWEAFKGDIPEGMCIVHANGDKFDNSINNLLCVTNEYIGSVYGYRCGKKGQWKIGRNQDHRRTIAHIDRAGNVIAFYRSSRAAAKGCGYLGHQSILDRCNHRNKLKSVWLPDGTTFIWENELDKFMREVQS